VKNLIAICLTGVILSLSCASASELATREDRRNRFVLLSGDSMYCSGVVVQTNYVVTAGHCVDGENNIGINGVAGEVLVDDDEADFALLRVPTPVFSRARVRAPRIGEITTSTRVLSLRYRFWGWGRVVGYQDGTLAIQMRGWPGMSGTGVFGEDGAWLGVVVAFFVVDGEPADVTFGPSAPLVMSKIINYLENDR